MIQKWEEFQLKFDLELDEAEGDAEERAITPEEARQISEAARVAFVGGQVRDMPLSGRPDWFEEYLRLIEHGWPWRVATYIAWAASPKIGRWPATLKELATNVLGLKTPKSIYGWRKRHPTLDATVSVMQAAPLFEHRRDVLEALVEMASREDYKGFNDRKLYLELTGDYIPRSQLQLRGGSAKDLGELSDEELDALMGAEASPLTPLPKTGEGNTEGDEGEGAE